MKAMKAKCPHCHDGCPQCTGGFVDATIPSGPDVTRYDKVCEDCGTVAGGCVTGPGLPSPRISPQAICPACRGQRLKLVAVDSPD